MTKSISPNFSIVTPNHNGLPFLSGCLDALVVSIGRCAKSSFEIILVDNGSTDTSIKTFNNFGKKHKHITTKIISLPKNLGFATAVNQGIKCSIHDYVCLLNNDLNLAPNWFSLISQEITDHPETTTFCGTVLNKDGTRIESQGLRFFMCGRCENINNGLPYSPPKKPLKTQSTQIWGSSAAVVVYKKSHIIKTGLFDESFFAYIEDVDLSYRLNKQGYKTRLNPLALSYHLGGGTSNRMGTLRQYYTLRNWIKLIRKNFSLMEIISNFPGIIIERLRNVSYLIKSSLIM